MILARKSKQLQIGGMTCVNCQNKIEKKLRNTAGIQSAKVSYSTGIADIAYDTDLIGLKDITAIIQKLDYTVGGDDSPQTGNTRRRVGILLIIVSLYVILQQFGILNLLVPGQLADANMGYGMLFVIGLITSVHCVAMCGGINVSQCIPQAEASPQDGRFSTLRPAFLYNGGRVVSYTMVGFIVGGIGSAITFSNAMQGALKLIAGVFMIIMGINMLDLFPWLRRLNPRMPRFLTRRLHQEKAGDHGPFWVGMLNGLMPCGPLQAMQIYALATGNPFAGALSMFMFSLGTVPLMFGLGALSTVLGKKFTRKAMSIGAVLVVVLGLSMLSQGWSLSGFGWPGAIAERLGIPTDPGNTAQAENGVQVVRSTLSPGRYPAITVESGTPVKWIIDAPQGSINGCNNRILIPAYNMEYSFKTGENIIEFTPDQTGTFPYSCWMGMIRSTIRVVEPGTEIPPEEETAAPPRWNALENTIPAQPVPSDYVIPTEEIIVAQVVEDTQQVTMALTDESFFPAVIVVQQGMETQWTLNNLAENAGSLRLLVPAYGVTVPLIAGENPLFLFPSEDFDFSNADSSIFGYVKVVEDINNIDLEEIRREVSAFQPMIWPLSTFGGGGAASCH